MNANSSRASGVSTPLWSDKEIIGLLQVVRFGIDGVDFDKRDVQVCVVFAHQAALMIQNARLHTGLQTSVEKTIQGLVRALEAKDEYTSGHSEAVAQLTRLVAEQLLDDPRAVETVRRAALLHDIGKIGVPNSLLNKEGRLSAREFDILRSHPKMGARILEPLSFLSDLIPAVLHHHERWDGKGYPEGLAGEAIPLGARILAVTDTYHALVSDRAYRAGIDPRTAIEELRSCSGAQFDPEVVEALGDLLKSDTELVAAAVGIERDDTRPENMPKPEPEPELCA